MHGTALGVGERVGNTPMEQLLVNLKLLGWRDDDLSALPEYVEAVAAAVGVPIPVNAPIVGRDAFRTATGVHAAAVIKAKKKGADWLADRIYSGVPASWIGREQEIVIGHMSGASNVVYWLQTRGLRTDIEIVKAVLARAKKSEELLTEDEVLEVVREVGAKPDTTPASRGLRAAYQSSRAPPARDQRLEPGFSRTGSRSDPVSARLGPSSDGRDTIVARSRSARLLARQQQRQQSVLFDGVSIHVVAVFAVNRHRLVGRRTASSASPGSSRNASPSARTERATAATPNRSPPTGTGRDCDLGASSRRLESAQLRAVASSPAMSSGERQQQAAGDSTTRRPPAGNPERTAR